MTTESIRRDIERLLETEPPPSDLARRLADLRASLTARVEQLGPSETRARSLTPDHPMIWFPIRVETKVDGVRLRVRIYPDDALIDSHEPELTSLERELRDALDRDPAAWSRVVETLGEPRARWVARATIAGVASKTSAWTRAARARLLPDRFELVAQRRVAGAWVEALRASGKPVRYPMYLSLDPRGRLRADGDDDDPEAHWLHDFAAAVDAGMAFDVTDTSLTTKGYDRILVYGFRADTSPRDAASQVARLFDAHSYTRGLALVPHGAPTNNSSERSTSVAPRSAELARAKRDSGVGGAAGVPLWRALGINAPADVVTRDVPVAASRLGSEAHAQAANALYLDALWAGTLGYFGRHMLDGFQDATALRSDVGLYVRGAGPFPALRIGGTPYGILPLASRRYWRGVAGDLGGPHAPEVLSAIQRVTREIAKHGGASGTIEVPRLGATQDGVKDVLDVFGQDASATGASFRFYVGPELQQIITQEGTVDPMVPAARALINELGDARVFNLAQLIGDAQNGGELATPVDLLLDTTVSIDALKLWSTQDLRDTLKGIDPLAPYARDVGSELALHGVASPLAGLGIEPPTLVGILVRSALLEEWLDACAAKLTALGVTDFPLRYDDEIGHVNGGSDRRTMLLTTVMPGTTERVCDWVATALQQGSADPSLSRLLGVRAALAQLAELPSDVLGRAFGETLDVCSHRIDAWWTALASKRLAALRVRYPIGCHVGCFAVLEDLTVASPASVSPGGFIHAPSMDQAAVAAVLRNGVLSKKDDGKDVAIDLSSRATRDGLELLDAVRDGVPIGALLGFRFERALEDRQCASLITRMREWMPLRVLGTAPNGSTDAVAVSGTVDGLAVARAVRATGSAAVVASVTPPVPASKIAGVIAAMDVIERALDSVHDLLFAESVHQIVRGQPSRAYETFGSLGDGAAPPAIDVVATPRPVQSIGFRVLLALPVAAADPWNAIPLTPRAELEPAVDRWLASMLGAPRRYALQTESGARIDAVDLGLRPLDWLALSEGLELHILADPKHRADPKAEPHPLWRLVQAAVTQRGIDESVTLAGDDVALVDLLELVARARVLLKSTRPAVDEDLAFARARRRATPPSIDEARLDALFAHAHATVAALVAHADGTHVLDGLTLAAQATRWSVMPLNGEDPAATLRTELERRVTRARGLAGSRARLEALLGEGVIALPYGAVPDGLFEPENSELFTKGRRTRELLRWHVQHAGVRPSVNNWQALDQSHHVLGGAHASVVRQSGPGPWIGGALAGSEVGEVWSFVTHALERALGDQALLVIDEWSESIPIDQQSTGVAFHHDDPGAEGPQSLLTMLPAHNGVWSRELIEDGLVGLFELLAMRLASPKHLGELGGFLPALFIPGQTPNL